MKELVKERTCTDFTAALEIFRYQNRILKKPRCPSALSSAVHTAVGSFNTGWFNFIGHSSWSVDVFCVNKHLFIKVPHVLLLLLLL